MDLQWWGVIGIIVGIISTAWQPKLLVKSLILSVVVGAIGSISGGVLGYLFYGARFDGFDVSVFSVALILTCLSIIAKRKIAEFPIHVREPQGIQIADPMLKLNVN